MCTAQGRNGLLLWSRRSCGQIALCTRLFCRYLCTHRVLWAYGTFCDYPRGAGSNKLRDEEEGWVDGSVTPSSLGVLGLKQGKWLLGHKS